MLKHLQKMHRKIKNKKLLNDKNNNIVIDSKIISNVKIDIIGKNNNIILNNINIDKNTSVYVYIRGDNNTIKISNCSISTSLNIKLGQLHPNFGPISNSIFSIGEKSDIESLEYVTYNSNTNCIIGKNCMFSFDITIYNTDAHAILDLSNNKLVNYVKDVIISDHCWIGKQVNILKNTYIPKDCIIGANSVVSGKLKKEHAVYAGNPAVLVRENRTWDLNGKKHGYIDNIPKI